MTLISTASVIPPITKTHSANGSFPTNAAGKLKAAPHSRNSPGASSYFAVTAAAVSKEILLASKASLVVPLTKTALLR
jgi:hypothetical protein